MRSNVRSVDATRLEFAECDVEGPLSNEVGMGEYHDETEEEISLIMKALRAPISSSTKKLRGSRPDPTFVK